MIVLTQDIFTNQPAWVRSAAACMNGRVIGFSCSSKHLTPTGRFNTWIAEEGLEYKAINLASCYYVDDWANSAIDREEVV